MPNNFNFLKNALLFAISALGVFVPSTSWAQQKSVSIKSYGHSALLIKSDSNTVLINPFKAVGCASKLKEPKIEANVILASSILPDEGAKVAKGTFLVQPGSYRINGLQLEGFSIPHDRIGGRRFGKATIWRWTQGGLKFAHLGGSAAPLTSEAKVLLGRPDILIIGVGGGAKVYNGKEAAEIAKSLIPKVIIPVQYVVGAIPENCDQQGIAPFLEAMSGTKVMQGKSRIKLRGNLSNETIIHRLQ